MVRLAIVVVWEAKAGELFKGNNEQGIECKQTEPEYPKRIQDEVTITY
jgi:hypothetical protein